jgi:hypothetical protein
VVVVLPLRGTPRGSPFAGEAGEYLLTFEISTAAGRLGGSSDDLLAIVFSEKSGATVVAPAPLFGSDVTAEFLFSGADARPQKAFSFSRRVSDLTFLQSPYVRVINHGNDAWAGEYLSLSYQIGSGKPVPVLVKQSLYPRLGASRDAGLERYNGKDWSRRIYWEGELQRLRRDRTSLAR